MAHKRSDRYLQETIAVRAPRSRGFPFVSAEPMKIKKFFPEFREKKVPSSLANQKGEMLACVL